MSGQVLARVLPNGLKVLLKEIHTAPLASVWMWYRFGSRDDAPGETGSAHWIEHMQFKGTPNFSGEMLDRLISREGGVWNAFTYMDWTAYFITLPAEKIDLVLRLEADRMTNSRFDPQDFESERTVILAEKDGAQNDPYARLSDAVQMAAFERHPYRYPVIGQREDLLAMTRDTLYARYRAHYLPANAVLTAAGDFEAESLWTQIVEHFGGLPSTPAPPRRVVDEPPLAAEKRLEIRGADETPFLQIAYRTPAINSPDIYALHLLNAFLAGPSGLGVLGGGLSNRTSYLYRQLVAMRQAVSVHGSFNATLDPFLQVFALTLPPDSAPQAALTAFDEALDAVLQNGVQSADLQRALKQVRALFAYGRETVTQQASWLGYYEMLGGWDWFETYLARLQQVTCEDVLRVAQKWLHPQNRVVGFYYPEGT